MEVYTSVTNQGALKHYLKALFSQGKHQRLIKQRKLLFPQEKYQRLINRERNFFYLYT